MSDVYRSNTENEVVMPDTLEIATPAGSALATLVPGLSYYVLASGDSEVYYVVLASGACAASE